MPLLLSIPPTSTIINTISLAALNSHYGSAFLKTLLAKAIDSPTTLQLAPSHTILSLELSNVDILWKASYYL